MIHFPKTLLLAVVAVPTPLFAQLTLPGSLVAHYPFDGDALDISGNGNHGTVVGPVLTTDRFGTPNAAYRFDGKNDYIAFEGNRNFYPDLPVTFSAWIKLDTYASRGIFTNDFSSTNFYGVYINIVNGKVRVDFGDGGPGNSAHRRSKEGSRQLSLGTWYHIAIVMRGTLDMDIYVNGKRDCGFYDGTGGFNMAYRRNAGRAGHGKGINSPWFDGSIDDVRFYSRELTRNEILYLAAPDLLKQDITICLGESVALDAGDGFQFQWEPATALSCSNCATPIASPLTTTTYRAITTNRAGCMDTTSRTITVDCTAIADCDLANVLANFSTKSNSLEVDFAGTSTGNIDSVSWNMGDGTVLPGTSGLNFAYTYTLPDTYSVCLTAFALFPNGEYCSDAICQDVEVRVRNKKDLPQTWDLVPTFNPNVYQVTTQQPLPSGTDIEIWTMHGQILRSFPLQQNSQINFGPYAEAMYLVRLSTLYGAVKVRR